MTAVVTKEQNAWNSMKTRCYNQKSDSYPRYGGLGITVSPVWLHSFERFLSDVGPAPSIHHSLDRIDPRGNYEPGNVRWSTAKEQSNNRRNTTYVIYNGARCALTPLCRSLSVDPLPIRSAVKHNGGDFLAALDSYRRHRSPLKMASERVIRSYEMPRDNKFEIVGPVGRRVKDLSGKRYGMLVVVRMVGVTRYGCPVVEADCDCGVRGVLRLSETLKVGLRVSCGCSPARENCGKHCIKHGLSESSEYRTWRAAITRCENKNDKAYKNYGARGIFVDPTWRASFAKFYEDMGPRPSPKHQLDRIDNNGGYTSSNCRWATPKTQINNRRNTMMVDVDGTSLPLTPLCEAMGLDPAIVRMRALRGKSGAELLSVPQRRKRLEPGDYKNRANNKA